jgi:DNA invertase Pin-like site-specific DNA recombinase
MLFGYTLVLPSENKDMLDVQRRALRDAGVDDEHIYNDQGLDHGNLDACLQALKPGDTLVVWRIDRLARGLRHLVNLIPDLTQRDIGLKILTGHGAAIDTAGKNREQVVGFFAALSELEARMAARYAPRAEAAAFETNSVRRGSGRMKLTPVQIRAIQLAVKNPKTNITELCALYGISRTTLYRYVTPDGELRPNGLKILMQHDHGEPIEEAEAAAEALLPPIVPPTPAEVPASDKFLHRQRFLIASLVILALNTLVNGLMVLHNMRPAAVNLYLPGLFGVVLITSMFVTKDQSIWARLAWAVVIPEVGALVSYTFLSMFFWHELGYFGSPKGVEPWLMAATVTPLAIAKVWRISLLLVSYCGIDWFLFPPKQANTTSSSSAAA